uniref:Uncharacterized protein n=1 Tax=Oryza punctata TaxID=4537 RepID=A0A0E0KW60_ORYPU
MFPDLAPYFQEIKKLIERIRVSCEDGLKNLRSPVPANLISPAYLSKPAPGFVGELARVVADEVVPEAAIRLHEPLAGVDDAMIRPPPLLLPGAFRRASLRPSSPMRSISCMDMNVAGEDRSRSCIGVVMEKRIVSYVADPFCHHEYVVMHDASIIKVRREEKLNKIDPAFQAGRYRAYAGRPVRTQPQFWTQFGPTFACLARSKATTARDA